MDIRTGFASLDIIITHVFKLDPEEVRDALWRAWRTRFGLRDDGDMPRNDPPAARMQRFDVRAPNFQETFDRWAAEVEREGNGTLEITHEEPVVEGGTTVAIVIFWRIAPGRVVTGTRGRGR